MREQPAWKDQLNNATDNDNVHLYQTKRANEENVNAIREFHEKRKPRDINKNFHDLNEKWEMGEICRDI